MEGSSKTIVWFRRDLRIEDNPAFASACKDGSVLPVFIWCPEEEGKFYPGRCSRWWMKQSLSYLDKTLRSLGSPLVFIKSESTLSALLQCIGAIGASRVVYNHLYDPVSLVRDHRIKTQLVELGINVQSFNGDLLYEPWEVYDEGGIAFTTFDAFWTKCVSLPINEPTLHLPPWKIVPPAGIEKITSCSLEELGLENNVEKLSNALLSRGWTPGWSHANNLLTEFINSHLLQYSKNKAKVEGTTTSLLSPYLHFGEISVRKIYQTARMKQMQCSREGKFEANESIHLFLRSIGLREYSRYLCFNFPFTHQKSLLGNLTHYPWRPDENNFKAWRQGRTGYPLVDAGMRELWATGWMHNRIRMVAASFFVKFLLLPWTWGMKYFWDTLLDADLESDILGWQYISGSLPDGHELNRIDSPEVQGMKFDPEGNYVRTWLPELARMPREWIHHPWNCPKSVLEASGVELGVNYPNPIVDFDTAVDRLDDAVAMMWEMDRAARNGSSEVVDENTVDLRILDVPTVIVRREVIIDESSDQKVPSFRNVELKNLKVDDTSSTAESSCVKKRSHCESQSAVPTSFCSSSLYSFKAGDLASAPVVHQWQEMDGSRTKEEEDEAQSSSMCALRPSKKSA